MIEEDLAVIHDYLGESFLSSDNQITINTQRLDTPDS